MTTRRLALFLLLIAVLPPALAGAADFEESVPAEPGGRLRVDLRSGSVVIESHGRDEVRVDAIAAGAGPSLDLELRNRDGEVTLRGGARGWLANLLGARVRVRVRVPREFDIEVHTGAGAVEVEDIEGDVKCRTSGGPIGVAHIEGDVEIETSGGLLEANQIAGSIRAKTSGGPIRLSEIDGDVQARTSGGPIDVLDAHESVDARTSGGSVRVRFAEDADGTLQTSGGNIEVEIPAKTGIDLDARTSGGHVELGEALDVDGRVERNRVRARVNGGGNNLDLQTSGGSIYVFER